MFCELMYDVNSNPCWSAIFKVDHRRYIFITNKNKPVFTGLF